MGMNMANAFPSKYLSAADINGVEPTYHISAVVMEQVGRDANEPQKPVLYFADCDKGMVLNVTNNNTIMDMYGHDSDAWLGKPITIFATHVDFGGKMVPAIRVKPTTPTPAAAYQQNAQANAAQAPLTGGPEHNEANPPPVGDPLDA